MADLLRCMFDTVGFNRVVEGVLPIHTLIGRVVVFTTHVQLDEIHKTGNPEKKAALQKVFADLVGESMPTASWVLGTSKLENFRLGGERMVPTHSAVWDVSKYGQANYSADDNLYAAIKDRLDSVNKNKKNNVQDTLIAETAIKEGHVLITDDVDLATVTREFGGKCLDVAQLLTFCGGTPSDS